jgi:hypothetical protein
MHITVLRRGLVKHQRVRYAFKIGHVSRDFGETALQGVIRLLFWLLTVYSEGLSRPIQGLVVVPHRQDMTHRGERCRRVI